jgi:hypothetical protein
MKAHTLLAQIVPALGALALLTPPCIQAAEISWFKPQLISGDSDVRTNGSLVYAFNLNGPNVTINTVPFFRASFGSNLGAAGNALPPFTDLSANYQTLLRSVHYARCLRRVVPSPHRRLLIQAGRTPPRRTARDAPHPGLFAFPCV